VFREAYRLGCEGIVSKRLGSPCRSGRTAHWIKIKNPKAPAAKREEKKFCDEDAIPEEKVLNARR
jgi:bifunctional non-homologous end joining protein LigD